ncbi:MAG TPA: segregation/condensation protein A [Candidatus Wallbacteria bacterium]|nr:segregation/condensation protein A [Candidatus Wallbacteria bacterium]
MEYNVKLPIFEGPFDLLFHLVEKEKFDLNEIPLTKITKDYLDIIMQMQNLDIHLAGEFLVMAASLMRLKSKSILPKPNEYDRYLNPQRIDDGLDVPDMEDEAPFFFESQEDMINKLKEYKIYKDMAHKLREFEAYSSKIYYKTVEIETKSTLLTDDLNLDNLSNAFRNALKKLKDKKFQRIVVEKISVDDKIEQILKFLCEIKENTTFEELLETAETKFEMVMTFLAILELSKLQKIMIEQSSNFSGITVKKINTVGALAA